MNNIVIKKWVEPYVLLETIKKKYEIKDLTFDGFTKSSTKQEMLKLLSNNSFGLYMKNVNKFYVFTSNNKISTKEITDTLELSEDDFIFAENIEEAISAIDLAKAEASIIMQ